jgi:ribonuclease VapC
MVIDTSALIAIALGEPSRPRLLDAIESATGRIVSSVSLLEQGMVLRARLGQAALPLLYQLIDELVGEVVPLDEIQAKLV